VVWKTLLAAVPAAAVAFVSGAPSLVQAIIALVIFSVLALVFRAVPRELADLLPDSLKGRIPGLGA
jgi:hypothetical protein